MNNTLITSEEAVIWLREQTNMQEMVRDCYFDDPVEAAAKRFSNSEEWQEVTKFLKNHLPSKVLDIGAGRGISSFAFAKVGCQVTALEPDQSNLIGAGAIRTLFDQTNLRVQIIQEYGERLPFPDNSFDVVYVRAVLHHAKDLRMFCQEVSRVLKKGGAFLATREHVLSKKEDLQIFLDNHLLHFLHGNENAYLLSDYTNAIKGAGLKIVRIVNPFENSINYAPMTHEDFKNSVILSRLESQLGGKLSSFIVNRKILYNLCISYLSFKSNSPGRLYSFLALKP